MRNKNLLPKNSYTLWNDSIERPSFPKLKEQLEVDVAIAGGGLCGITAAYLLKDSGLSICVIDAASMLSGTTAHTTAKITAQHGLIYDEFIQHFGKELAKKYYNANIDALSFMKDTIKENNIDCDFTVIDAYIYTANSKELKQLENERAAYEALSINGAYTSDVDELPFAIKGALSMKDQAYFNPLKYGLHLLKACQEAGVQFFENTRAVNIEYNKRPAIVTEDHQRIICNKVIQATHYPFYDGGGFFPVKMYASRSYLLAAKVKNPITEGMYINMSNNENSRTMRPVEINGENHIIIGGSSHKTGQSYNSMLENYKRLEAFSDKHFELQEILYRWSAQDYVTLDKLPYVGNVTHHQIHVYTATGFRKWGITNSTNAALMAADMILNKSNSYQSLFAPSRSAQADPAIKNMISYNTDVAKHLIKGKFSNEEQSLHDLQPSEARIIRRNGKRIGVFKDEHNQLYAVDTTCTHLGCEVAWNQAELSWDCPCHGSRFNYKGEVINGPAVKALKNVTIK